MLYKIADVVFDVQPCYEYSLKFMADYEYDGSEKSEFTIKFDKAEIDGRLKAEQCTSPAYCENLMIFRKICEYLFENKRGFIFHSSAVLVNGDAVLFAAPSGVGKSTHAKFWQSVFSDVSVINDDKPIIRQNGNKFTVYGTPWRGKRNEGSNTEATLKAICFVERSEQNSVVKIDSAKALPLILNQTLRFACEESYDLLFEMIADLIVSVGVYLIRVNMSNDAAITVRRAVLEDI